MERRLKVLTVLPDVPFPPISGLDLRMVGNLDLVSRLGCESHLAYFSTAGRPHDPSDRHLRELTTSVVHLGSRLEQYEFSRASLIRQKADFIARGAVGWAGSTYPFSMRYDVVGAQDKIVMHANLLRCDVVVIPSILIHYAKRLRDAGFHVIADAADILSELTLRLFRSGKGEGFVSKASLFANYLASLSQERIFFRFCSEVWVTSEAENQSLRSIENVAAITIPNTIDESKTVHCGAPGSNTIGFIGTFSISPNIDALRYLMRDIMPAVWRSVPSANVIVAGAGLDVDDLSSLFADSRTSYLGAIENSADLFNQSDVLALPVRLRGGVPLKLIEAMARKRPVVATPELVFGLGLDEQNEVLVGKDANEFGTHIATLLRDRQRATAIAESAYRAFYSRWSRNFAEEQLRRHSILGQTALGTKRVQLRERYS